ncbi:MAG TPA: YihY/virulence factor BrkB family protein [Gemmataceae bacterium]|nr:YihY/virulence factor BrkB family protein [Gemmataceae bacterium]
MNWRNGWNLLKETYHGWSQHNVAREGAALAYYTIFSLAPLLIIAIGISGLIIGEKAARGELQQQLTQVVGAQTAATVQSMVANTKRSGSSVAATVVGFVVLIFGALGVFSQLQESLNLIWGVQPKSDRGIRGMIMDRVWSFLLVLGIGILILVSVAISTALSGLNHLVPLNSLPGGAIWWQVVNNVVSFIILMLLFAMIYKLLPDVEMNWKDVWIGALATAVLFTIGKYLIGLYLGSAGAASSFGAAGSLVLILLWVYYSTQICLFGAEFTKVWAKHYGTAIRPSANAVWVVRETRPAQAPSLPPQGRSGTAPV